MINSPFGSQDNRIPEHDAPAPKRKLPRNAEETGSVAKPIFSQKQTERLENIKASLKEKVKTRRTRDQQKRARAGDGEAEEGTVVKHKKVIEEDTSSEHVGKKRAKHSITEKENSPAKKELSMDDLTELFKEMKIDGADDASETTEPQ